MMVVLMVVLFDDSDVLVEAENGAGEEERLGDVVEQPIGDVVDVDDLIGYERDAAYDEQHGTGVLGDFEAIVFHSVFLGAFTLKINKKLFRK